MRTQTTAHVVASREHVSQDAPDRILIHRGGHMETLSQEQAAELGRHLQMHADYLRRMDAAAYEDAQEASDERHHA